ncbi:MAG: outer membrane lipoprotein carrier protein LolA [Pyrinomonadaceae bacterium]|nr:outer membrane lipoprotein carrier protein LolA [Pyrinomonadaceae bacterium]
MKSYSKLGLAAIAVTLFFGALVAAETKAQSATTNEILNRMNEHNKALSSLQASVKMDKFNSQLDEHSVTEGTAKYLPLKGRDALVRIDWTKPLEESLAVVNKQYILYRPRLKQAIIGKVDNAKSGGKGANNALAFINMSKDQLKANYTIIFLGQENVSGGTPTWRLQLTPKTSTNYKTAELWVDGNGMPIQAKVIEGNNDATTVFLSNLQKNGTLKTDVFIIKLPKDVKKIDG